MAARGGVGELERRVAALLAALRPARRVLETELRALGPAAAAERAAWDGAVELWMGLLSSGDLAGFRDALAKNAAELARSPVGVDEAFEAQRAVGRALRRTLELRPAGSPEAIANELDALAALDDVISSALLHAAREASAMREREAREEGQFLLDLVLHDAANINTAAAGYLQLLARDPQLPREAAAFAAKAAERLKAVDGLFSQVREFSRARSPEVALGPIELRSVISRAMAKVVSQHPKRRVEFRQTLPERLVWVSGTPRLEDLVVNLLSNAVKFDPHEPVQVEVAIAREPLGGVPGWTLRVSDRGPGIPPERRSQLFERFSQGQKAVHGSGLGLSIVRALAERFGGRVWIEDRIPGKPSEGSSFVVWLCEAASPSMEKRRKMATPSAVPSAENG